MGNRWRTRFGTALAMAVVLAGSAPVLAAGTAGPMDAEQQRHGQRRERDLAAFDRIMEQQNEAWFREDAEAFAATFTADADLVTFNGDHLRARQGIADGMRYYVDEYIDHTRIRVVDEHVRFAGPRLAIIVRTACQVQPPDTTGRPDSLSRNTNVLVKQRGSWRQESFQNTRFQALP
jgi:uncharacterized protein (TIGR02246 family)